MPDMNFETIFTEDTLMKFFPAEKADMYFEALFGDAEEGSFDIKLSYSGQNNNILNFNLELLQRPGKCLACNLTYGLPQVFSRHPVIDIPGLVKNLDTLLGETAFCKNWELGPTREISRELHIVPLNVEVQIN